MASATIRRSWSLAIAAVALGVSPLVSLSVQQMSPLKPLQLPPTTRGLGLLPGFIAWWVLAPVLFLLLTLPSLRHPERRPFASLGVIVVCAAGSAFWYSIAWPYAIHWQGQRFVRTTIVMNVLGLIILLVLSILAFRKPSFRRTFLLNAALAFWLLWYPFPWFGELP